MAGRFEKELTRRSLRTSFSGPWGSSSSEARLEKGECEEYGRQSTVGPDGPSTHR